VKFFPCGEDFYYWICAPLCPSVVFFLIEVFLRASAKL